VKPGDVLLAVNGKAVSDPQGMLNVVAALQPGMKVPLKLRREARDVEVEVEIAKRPAAPPAKR
jgi:S1-C subfamily serine protease